jgi:hypothetical protein
VNNISVSRRCVVSIGLDLDIDESPCAFICGSRRRGKADLAGAFCNNAD